MDSDTAQVLTGLGGIGGGAAITSLLAWLLNWNKQSHAQQRESHTDSIVEYQKIVESYRTELASVRRDHTTEVASIRLELVGLYNRNTDLTTQNMECEKGQERLRGEIRLLQNSVQRLQAITPDISPATTTPTIIVASIDGKIRHIGPSVAPMFHWMPNELLAKSIEVLIPERYKVAHRTALKTLQESGNVPWTDKVLLGHGITKDGTEFPVAITLSAWKSDKGEWLISAEIRYRPAVVSNAEAINTSTAILPK